MAVTPISKKIIHLLKNIFEINRKVVLTLLNTTANCKKSDTLSVTLNHENCFKLSWFAKSQFITETEISLSIKKTLLLLEFLTNQFTKNTKHHLKMRIQE